MTSLSTYLGYQIYANNMQQSLQRVADEGANATAQSYYNANIGSVTSVDDFIGNYRLFSYAMKASGLEDMTYAKAFMKQVLTSDLSDPSSFVNKLTDPRFKAFAQQFSFATTSTATAQSSTQEDRTIALYSAKTGPNSVAGILATNYYEQNIGKVKSLQDLMGNSQLVDYVMTAYGLDPSTLDNGSYVASTNAEHDLAAVFESDASDPNSTASQMADGNTDTSNIPVAVQSASQQAATSTAYTALYGRTTNLIYYEDNIGSAHSLTDFLANPQLVSVAEQAYGLDPNAYSTTDVQRILTSNLSDPMSVANQLGAGAVAFAKAFNFSTSSTTTSPYLAIAQDFNFDASGNIAAPRLAQSAANTSVTESLYNGQAGSDPASQAAATAATSYYTGAISSVTTLGSLMSNQRLVTYIKTAYGLPATTSNNTLQQILTSDLTNPKSVANTMGDATQRLAAAFNFSTSGTIERDTGGAQSANAAQITDDNYLEQSLQDEAGQTDQGVQLALYFQQKVTSGAVTSAYSILADPALLKVVQTALGIPAASSSQDIDLQAKVIGNRLNLSSLKNPTTLNKFISQFAALYDLANSQSSTNTVATLFGA